MSSEDKIRDTVSAQAERLGLSAYAIGQLTEIDSGTVKRYLSGRRSINSRYVSRICEALDLELRPKSRSGSKK
jgi:predicted transcriptional regulator